jgi:hypothetical protein
MIGAATAVFCLLLGMRPWLLIGLFVVVASLIPVFGPYLGAIPAVAVALIAPTHFLGWHLSPIAAVILVVVFFGLINEIGSKVLYPKLVGAALGLHTVFVLFVLFAGLELAGIVGVLFAAPITALAIVTFVHLYRFWQDLPDDLLADVARRQARTGLSASQRADQADSTGAAGAGAGTTPAGDPGAQVSTGDADGYHQDGSDHTPEEKTGPTDPPARSARVPRPPSHP